MSVDYTYVNILKNQTFLLVEKNKAIDKFIHFERKVYLSHKFVQIKRLKIYSRITYLYSLLFQKSVRPSVINVSSLKAYHSSARQENYYPGKG